MVSTIPSAQWQAILLMIQIPGVLPSQMKMGIMFVAKGNGAIVHRNAKMVKHHKNIKDINNVTRFDLSYWVDSP